MRTSFDLLGTILDRRWSFGPVGGDGELGGWVVRPGALRLFRQLREAGHEIWFYTSACASPDSLHSWFSDRRVELGGVVDAQVHVGAADEHWAGPGAAPRKFPPWFGIELHFDDSSAIVADCSHHEFEASLLDPADEAWVDTVLAEIEARCQPAP